MASAGTGLEQAIGGDGGPAAAQAASASNGVQGLVQALHGLIVQKSSGFTDLKIASVVAALPPNLRVHIQMALQDDTTFEDLRQRIELYEQVSQRWMSEGGLQLSVRPMAEVEDKGGPMEVDAVWSKDGGRKGGKKGGKKGKDKGKQKGKGSWSKDGGKKGKGGKPFVKGDGKKGKGMGTCHNCGKPGHYAKELLVQEGETS